MAKIAPFNGIRFGVSGDISRLIAPPYDVIDDKEHASLCKTNPTNIIHLTLGAPGSKQRDYRSIGGKLHKWLKEGTFHREQEKSFYAYCQEYTMEGQRLKFWGLFALLKLNEFGKGPVYPHEKVHQGPVDDRYKIMEATKANLEPIMVLYRAPNDPMNMLYSSLEGLPPVSSAVLTNGTRHRMWKLSMPHTRARIQRMIGKLPLVIADGHHRYNSALIYRRAHPRMKGVDHMMVLIGNTEQKGIRILPINRLITSVTPITLDLVRDMAQFGRVEKIGRKFNKSLLHLPKNTLGFFNKKAGAWLVHLPPLPAKTAPRETLEVTRLHDILPQVIPVKEIIYTKKAAEDIGSVAKNPSVLACFLPPPSSSTICAVAFGNEFLPQKSTFFQPKPQSGMVLRLIE